MKKNLIIITIVLALGWTACQPEDLKPFTEVDNGSVSALYGTWTGVTINQRDIGAENKGFPYKSEEMTVPLDFTNLKLTLNGTGTTTADFNVDYGANAPEFFPFSSGNWKVDNPAKVGKVYLINAANTDTVTLVLGSYQNFFNNEAKFTQTKTLLGAPAIVYEFRFSK